MAFVLILASESLRGKDWGEWWQKLRGPAQGPSAAQAGFGDKLA